MAAAFAAAFAVSLAACFAACWPTPLIPAAAGPATGIMAIPTSAAIAPTAMTAPAVLMAVT